METSSKIIKKSTVVTEVSSKFETAIKSQLRKNVEGLSITDIPMPEVIKRVVSAIDDRSDVPGEIKTDTEGRLLKEFLEYDGIIKPMIQAFDHFIDIQLVRRIENTSIPFALGVISFENVMIFKPSTVSQSEKKEKRVPIYPYMCRRNRTSYTITLKCSVVFTPKDESRPIEKMVCNLGEIPVMLGSKYCNLCGLISTRRRKSSIPSFADLLPYRPQIQIQKLTLQSQKCTLLESDTMRKSLQL